MTGNSKYNGRNETSTEQSAELHRRVNRLETVRGPVDYVIISEADFATPPYTVTSGTFTVVAYLWPAGARPGVEVYLRVQTPSATTMELQLVEYGGATVYSPVATITPSSDGFQGLRGRAAGSNIAALQLEARIASGVGTGRVGVVKAIGGNFASELFS